MENMRDHALFSRGKRKGTVKDIDVSGNIKRDEFSASTQHVTDRLLVPVKQVLADTQTSPGDVHSIEIVGGGVRVPAIRESLSTFFEGKSLSTTLNGDEAVARGCALQCAMLSPAFRVRQFQVKDVSPYPIELCWGPVTDNFKDPACQFEDKTTLFTKFNLIPSVKMIQFTKSEPFQLVLRYLDGTDIPGSTFISRHIITPPPVPADAISAPRIKVQIELSLHGLVGIKSVRLYEEVKPEPEASAASGKEAKTDSAAPMEDDSSKADASLPDAETSSGDADAPMEDDATPSTETPDADAMDTSKDGEKDDKPKKKKKKYKKTELVPQVDFGYSLSADEFKAAFEKEVEMANQDRVVEETLARKNELESYVYDTRAKLEPDEWNKQEAWTEYVSADASADFKEKLNAAEFWLDEDGYDATKSAYVEKITELRKIGDPIAARKWEADHRKEAVDVLKTAIDQYQAFHRAVQDQKENHAHITDDELATIEAETTKAKQWLTDVLDKQEVQPSHEDPVFRVADCKTKLDAVNKACYSIMTKPKPKPKVEEPKPAAPEAEAAKPAAADETMTDEKPAADAEAGKDAPAAEAEPAQENGEVPMQD